MKRSTLVIALLAASGQLAVARADEVADTATVAADANTVAEASAPAANTPSATALSANAIADAERLINRNDYVSAYALLKPLEPDYAGEPRFDYLLGLAALEAGKNTESVFAFERCLAVDPLNGLCRVQIARAYYRLGETENARNEFYTVRKSNPPAEVMSATAQYLNMIMKQEEQLSRTGWSGYAELQAGYDSNASTGINQSQVSALPEIFQSSYTGTSNGDGFGSISAGANMRRPVAEALVAYGSLSLSQREHSELDTLDNQSVDLSGSLALSRGVDNYQFRLNAQNYSVDGEEYRYTYGGTVQWQHAFGSGLFANSYLQYLQFTYPDQDARDSVRPTLGGAVSWALDMMMSPVVYASAYVAREEYDEESSNISNQGIGGLRLGGQLSVLDRVQLQFNASVERRKSGDDFNLIGTGLLERVENQYDTSLAVQWQPIKNAFIKPQVGYTRNDSTVVTYDYDRLQSSVSFRYEFQ